MARSPHLSIVIPTISGREHHLERCLDAYSTTTLDYETIIIRDRPTCGVAWNEGIAKAKGEFIHLSADDLEPHPGWIQAALAKTELGFVPAPRILKPTGELESCGWDDQERPDGSLTPYSRIPFAPKKWFDMIGPMLETHYMNDNYFSDRASFCGWQSVIARAYLFTHHWASEGRLDARLKEDIKEYDRTRS